jgi:hypothetical protein
VVFLWPLRQVPGQYPKSDHKTHMTQQTDDKTQIHPC